jgi:hypothetical protein
MLAGISPHCYAPMIYLLQHCFGTAQSQKRVLKQLGTLFVKCANIIIWFLRRHELQRAATMCDRDKIGYQLGI